MKVVEDVRTAFEPFPNVVLTIGSFDGVHVGHRAILDDVVTRAKACDGTAALMTLRPHPRFVFRPDDPPALLTSERKKEQLVAEAGIDVFYYLRFDTDVAQLEPRRFVEEILVDRCRADHIVIGHDFRFGKNAAGDFDYLCAVAPEFDFTVTEYPPVLVDGERVSSTRIRHVIAEGDMQRAATFLGRPYSVTGEVISGRGIGRKLGFPTANIRPDNTAFPADGIYACIMEIAGEAHVAAANVGWAPTIRHNERTVEAYILDFDEDISGQAIELFFYKRLRPEQKFQSHDELIAAIDNDVRNVRAYFAESGA